MKRKLLNTKKDIALQSERERKKEYEEQGREIEGEKDEGSEGGMERDGEMEVSLDCFKTNWLYTILVTAGGGIEDKD